MIEKDYLVICLLSCTFSSWKNKQRVDAADWAGVW